MTDKIAQIASRHLGQNNQYVDQYDKTLLVAIPRQLNRQQYAIDDANLPFVGFDVWQAYEVSFLTDNGLPINGVLKIILPADSPTHVESKSLKLYLNSFNMTMLGADKQAATTKFMQRVGDDLSQLLSTEIAVGFFQHGQSHPPLAQYYTPIDKLIDIEAIHFNTTDNQLKISQRLQQPHTFLFCSDLLRSNCRITNQPDWADVFIHIQTQQQPDYAAFLRYLVSQRKLNHFHEEVCEMLYVDLFSTFQPTELMVTCLYTRRGGIDINPVRASSLQLIQSQFYDTEQLNTKTLRQ